MWIRCKYEEDEVGMYLTPLIGYSNRGGDKSFWIGWLWWLWTFRLTKRAADGWIGRAFDFILHLTKSAGEKLPYSTRR